MTTIRDQKTTSFLASILSLLSAEERAHVLQGEISTSDEAGLIDVVDHYVGQGYALLFRRFQEQSQPQPVSINKSQRLWDLLPFTYRYEPVRLMSNQGLSFLVGENGMTLLPLAALEEGLHLAGGESIEGEDNWYLDHQKRWARAEGYLTNLVANDNAMPDDNLATIITLSSGAQKLKRGADLTGAFQKIDQLSNSHEKYHAAKKLMEILVPHSAGWAQNDLEGFLNSDPAHPYATILSLVSTAQSFKKSGHYFKEKIQVLINGIAAETKNADLKIFAVEALITLGQIFKNEEFILDGAKILQGIQNHPNDHIREHVAEAFLEAIRTCQKTEIATQVFTTFLDMQHDDYDAVQKYLIQGTKEVFFKFKEGKIPPSMDFLDAMSRSSNERLLLEVGPALVVVGKKSGNADLIDRGIDIIQNLGVSTGSLQTLFAVALCFIEVGQFLNEEEYIQRGLQVFKVETPNDFRSAMFWSVKLKQAFFILEDANHKKDVLQLFEAASANPATIEIPEILAGIDASHEKLRKKLLSHYLGLNEVGSDLVERVQQFLEFDVDFEAGDREFLSHLSFARIFGAVNDQKNFEETLAQFHDWLDQQLDVNEEAGFYLAIILGQPLKKEWVDRIEHEIEKGTYPLLNEGLELVLKHHCPVSLRTSVTALELGTQVLTTGSLYRVGSLQALIGLAEYTGVHSIADLLAHGDFGLGTYHGLDGEMIVVDGVAHQVLPSGEAQIANPQLTTPFALVTNFNSQNKITTTQNFDLRSLETYLSKQLPEQARSYAFKIYGTFNNLLIRTVLKQEPPYTTDIKMNGFQLGHVTGTLVGFRFPDSKTDTTGSGYHFHFVSDDKKYGGHVLEFDLNAGAKVDTQELVREEVYAESDNLMPDDSRVDTVIAMPSTVEEIAPQVDTAVVAVAGLPAITADALVANTVNPLIGIPK